MKKLFEVRVGGGRVRPGLLPVQALKLIQDLMGAMAEEGGDPDAWARANPHVEIIGTASTNSAVLTEEYQELIGPAQLFVFKAAERNLGRKGIDFVDKNFQSDQTWAFAEIIVCNGNRPRVVFDADYRESVKEERRSMVGIDDLYARVVRVGGEDPTAKLEIGKQSGTFKVASQQLAKRLGNHLFETVKISAEVAWDTKTLEILHLTVLDLDEAWQDVHLAEIIETHGGELPIELAVKSTSELLAERRRAREEN